MYLDQEQQGMIKRALVMRQQHCGTPYQTMQGVFQLLGSSSFFISNWYFSENCTCSLFALNMLFAYVLCLSLCFYLCMHFIYAMRLSFMTCVGMYVCRSIKRLLCVI